METFIPSLDSISFSTSSFNLTCLAIENVAISKMIRDKKTMPKVNNSAFSIFMAIFSLRLYNKRMKKIFLLLAALIFFTCVAYCETAKEKTVSGTVVDIDWVSSSLTVRYFAPFSPNADELTFKVTSESLLQKGTESIGLSDIEQADPVSVTYYDDGTSGLKVKKLTDLNLASL